MYLSTYIHIGAYTHARTHTERENLIKPGLYVIAFKFWNDRVKLKVIKNNICISLYMWG